MKNKIKQNSDRMLVSLGFDGNDLSLIESLVMLASHLNAELCGLFTDDSELQQIAKLPFSREITFLTAHSRELNSEQITRHLKQHSDALRKMMQEFSRLSNVVCSFKTAKGPRIESVLSAAYDFQVVVFLPETYTALKPKSHARLGELINPTLIFYNASKQAEKLLYIVKSLVEKGDLRELKVLTLNHDYEDRIREQFLFDEVKVNFKRIGSYNISSIISSIDTQKTGLVILPLEDEIVSQSNAIKELLNVFKCPLLLVR